MSNLSSAKDLILLNKHTGNYVKIPRGYYRYVHPVYSNEDYGDWHFGGMRYPEWMDELIDDLENENGGITL